MDFQDMTYSCEWMNGKRQQGQTGMVFCESFQLHGHQLNILLQVPENYRLILLLDFQEHVQLMILNIGW